MTASAEYQTFHLGPYGYRLDGAYRPDHFALPCLPQVRSGRLAIYPTRETIGPPDPDADDALSTINFMDLSSGIGIRVINPSSDITHSAWATADVRYTDGWTNPPLPAMAQPGSFSGNVSQFLRIGATTYGLWGTSLHPWDSDAHTWGAGTALGATPVGEGVSWNGAAYFPCGATGYVRIAESSPGTLAAPATIAGAASPTSNDPVPTSNPRPLLFTIYQQNLWAITTAATGYVLALSTTGATGEWVWPYQTNRETFVKVNTSVTPRKLLPFINRDGERALWLITNRGGLRYDEGNIAWEETNLWDVPPHPDFGRDAIAWRPGEDLWIVGGGGDMVQYTNANSIQPGAGPGGTGEGLPAAKRGSIVALSSDIANLWALLHGDTSADSTPEIVEDSPYGDAMYVPDALATSAVLAYNGKGWHPLWESSEPTGAPTDIYVSDAPKANGHADYRVFWGVGDEAWSMPCRLTMYSSRQGRERGIDAFAPSSYIEWGEFSGGSIAKRKLASHVAIILNHGAQNGQYVTYEYQTDADPPTLWHTLGSAYDPNKRTVLPFGLSDDTQFSSGLDFLWIKQRLGLFNTGASTTTPDVRAISLGYLITPQDAGNYIFTVPLPLDTDARTEKTRQQIQALLYGYLESREFLHLIWGERHSRVYVAGVSETVYASDDAFGALTLNLIEVRTRDGFTIANGLT